MATRQPTPISVRMAPDRQAEISEYCRSINIPRHRFIVRAIEFYYAEHKAMNDRSRRVPPQTSKNPSA